ncbi:MAG: hypothetical protein H6560_19005 [Lewinellaceae bacterium]|nr:hypothetical protein [Lewinellaceae bacterium]
MKRLSLLLALAGLSVAALNAQEDSPTEISFRLYGNALYLKSERVPRYYRAKPRPFEFMGFTPAFSVRNAGSRTVHEVEASFHWRNETVEMDRAREREFGFRYELGSYLEGNLFKIIRVRLGGGLLLYYYDGRVEPLTTTRFPRDLKSGGFLLSFIPHFEIPLGQRFFADFNASVFSIGVGIEHSYIHHPLFTERQRDQTSIAYDLGVNRFLRLGLGVRL